VPSVSVEEVFARDGVVIESIETFPGVYPPVGDIATMLRPLIAP
jgi:hypothetical protein